MALCSKCGNPLSETAAFCEMCGTPVQDVTASASNKNGVPVAKIIIGVIAGILALIFLINVIMPIDKRRAKDDAERIAEIIKSASAIAYDIQFDCREGTKFIVTVKSGKAYLSVENAGENQELILNEWVNMSGVIKNNSVTLKSKSAKNIPNRYVGTIWANGYLNWIYDQDDDIILNNSNLRKLCEGKASEIPTIRRNADAKALTDIIAYASQVASDPKNNVKEGTLFMVHIGGGRAQLEVDKCDNSFDIRRAWAASSKDFGFDFYNFRSESFDEIYNTYTGEYIGNGMIQWNYSYKDEIMQYSNELYAKFNK